MRVSIIAYTLFTIYGLLLTHIYKRTDHLLFIDSLTQQI